MTQILKQPMNSNKVLNNIYLIDRDHMETDESYYVRVWFITNQLEKKSTSDINDLIKFSRIIRNIKLYDCEYSKTIMQKLAFYNYRTV